MRLLGFTTSRAAWLLLMLAIAGCASLPPMSQHLPPQRELHDVPFIPQSDYQCGPAALATVLQASGVRVSADELVPRVYLPARQGSLQTELIAATRQYERLPYTVSAEVSELLVHVGSGRPVLVLQNLRLRSWPQWHFAVLVGFDRTRDEVILRSGIDRRHTMSLRAFVRTWDRAGRWGMLVMPPDQLPAEANADRYLVAAAGLEAVRKLNAARTAYETARTAWPASHWPYLGLANVAYLQDRLADARELYEQALVHDPTNLSARFNLGDTLARQGCALAARGQFERALEVAGDSALRARIEARMQVIEMDSPTSERGECP